MGATRAYLEQAILIEIKPFNDNEWRRR